MCSKRYQMSGGNGFVSTQYLILMPFLMEMTLSLRANQRVAFIFGFGLKSSMLVLICWKVRHSDSSVHHYSYLAH